ncbi:COQ3 [Scenedesmus sp. PABB004]|nr:COQ3 [Scenedesmus sp. PABB004]
MPQRRWAGLAAQLAGRSVEGALWPAQLLRPLGGGQCGCLSSSSSSSSSGGAGPGAGPGTPPAPPAPEAQSLDRREASKFAALADSWWDAAGGPFAPLHALNAARCAFLRRGVCALRGLRRDGAEPFAGLRVLDVGCGGGLLSEPVARLGGEVTGIDVSDEGVAAAAAHAAGDPLLARRISYRRATLEALVAEGASFDVVMASEVIEHVRRPAGFLASLAAAAAPGGQVLVTTLNRTPASYALAIVGAEYVARVVPAGTHSWSRFITPQELGMMAADAGLRLELLAGMAMRPGGRFALTDDVGVNYAALFSKPAAAAAAHAAGGAGGAAGAGRQRGGGAPPPPVTAASLLQEAETLQQRAERKSGADGLMAFEAAATKFRAALDAGLDATSRPDAAFGLGECLQLWADLLLQLTHQAPDAELTAERAAAAQARAVALYADSVRAYEQVPAPGGPEGALRPDAAVNCANALTSWAELAAGAEQRALLQQAVGLYRAALQQEEDALTLSNLGDALVAAGEAALAAGDGAAGQAAFQAALGSYEASCSLTDSSAGDDLPGLLHNWGVGLHTIAKQAQACELRHSLLEQAAAKLRSSAEFSRADPAPHNALGDVLMDAAELSLALAGAGGFGGAAPLGSEAAERAAALVQQAVDGGYAAALTICRTNADALVRRGGRRRAGGPPASSGGQPARAQLPRSRTPSRRARPPQVGLAEAGVAMAKLARRRGDEAAAARHAAAAAAHYGSALQRPHLLGAAGERVDVRYNAACAAALAGRPDLAQPLLAGLAAAGALVACEAAGDEDLAALRGEAWFGALLQQQQHGQEQPAG